MPLGIVIATETSPTPMEFSFVISEPRAQNIVENGLFVIVTFGSTTVIGVVQQLIHTNRYYNSPELVHGASNGISTAHLFPSDRWKYLIAETRVLGMITDGLFRRSTQPIAPGLSVEIAPEDIVRKFVGFEKEGLQLGRLRQMDIDVNIPLDKLMQKHLAILSISGGGKSYATSVIIEELLRRKKSAGRPAQIIFDVHGEFKSLAFIREHPEFAEVDIQVINGQDIQLSVAQLSPLHFAKISPNMSRPQQRELGKVLTRQKREAKVITIPTLMDEISGREMNPLVQEALLGWLGALHGSGLFGYQELPDLELNIKPGKLLIVDLSSIISLWKKQVIVYYMIDRLFSLRREKLIPPIISYVEEAHQFCPENTVSPAKDVIETIAREGRKFLCSLVLISQRPVNLSTTALSQCNSQIILRILNPNDLAYISKTSEGITTETLKTISSLGVGEALLTGACVNYPVFIQIRQRLSDSTYDQVSLAAESQKFENYYSEKLTISKNIQEKS